MIKWYSEDIEPTKSKNIVIKMNDNSVHYYGDYTYNKSNEVNPLDWNKFKAYILILNHSKFEWCYWEDVEKMLIKEKK
jgi:hypothetical protein